MCFGNSSDMLMVLSALVLCVSYDVTVQNKAMPFMAYEIWNTLYLVGKLYNCILDN